MKKLEQIKNLNPKKNQPPPENPNLSPNLVPHIVPPVKQRNHEAYVPFVVAITLLFQLFLVIIILHNFLLNRTILSLEKDMNNTYALVQRDINVFEQVDTLSRKTVVYESAMQSRSEIGKYVESMLGSIAGDIELNEVSATGNRGTFEITTHEALSGALLIHNLFETRNVDSVAITAADLNDKGEYTIKMEILFL